jgi:alkyldihydroxyacetonephosphate synthase
MLIFLHEGPHARSVLEASAVAAICAEVGGEAGDPAAVDAWFEHRNTVPAWEALFEQGIVADTVEIATSWRHLGTLYREVRRAVEAVPGVIACSAHSSHAYRSGANLYFTFAASPETAEDMAATYEACWEAAMAAAARCGAGLAHHHGIGRVRSSWLAEELGDAGVDLLRAIKHALDPDGLFNPGVLLPEPRARSREDPVGDGGAP